MTPSCIGTISHSLPICPDSAHLVETERRLRSQLKVTRSFAAGLELAQFALVVLRTRRDHEETCVACRSVERQVA
jgi:hypothetical protein